MIEMCAGEGILRLLGENLLIIEIHSTFKVGR